MVGAIQLTLQKETPSKKQEAFEQNARDFTKTVVKLLIKTKCQEVSTYKGPLIFSSSVVRANGC